MNPPLLRWYPLEECTLIYTYADPEFPGPATVTREYRSIEDGVDERRAEMVETILSERPPSRTPLAVVVTEDSVIEGGIRILAGPVEAGTAWIDGPDDWRIDAVGVPVTVPAGTFYNCLQIVYSNEDTGGGTVWLAEGMGLVRHERSGERGPFLYELQSIQSKTDGA